MPEVDFSNVSDATDFTPLPGGAYLCRLMHVEIKTIKQGGNIGAEYFGLEFVVITGEYAGRKIFDSLHFTKGALPRVKLVCSRLGIDCEAKTNVTPTFLMTEDRYTEITVEVKARSFADPRDGKIKDIMENNVPFAGYRKLSEEETEKIKEDDDNLPF